MSKITHLSTLKELPDDMLEQIDRTGKIPLSVHDMFTSIIANYETYVDCRSCVHHENNRKCGIYGKIPDEFYRTRQTCELAEMDIPF